MLREVALFMANNEKIKGKWSTGRLVFGIILMVLFVVVALQSCMVGVGNALSNSGEISGSFGFLCALSMLIAGIIGVATRNSHGKGGPVAACVFCWAVFFFSRIGAGSYADLRVWGFIGFFAGAFYLFAGVSTKKGNIIAAVIAALYFLLGIA